MKNRDRDFDQYDIENVSRSRQDEDRIPSYIILCDFQKGSESKNISLFLYITSLIFIINYSLFL